MGYDDANVNRMMKPSHERILDRENNDVGIHYFLSSNVLVQVDGD